MNPPPAEGLASRLFLTPALRAQPDRRLVTLVRDGYDAAFEEIVRRYGRTLGRYAAAIVGSRSEDVTQDAFSKALLAMRRRPEAEIELRPWLYRIVRNTALNDLRDQPPDSAELVEGLGGGTRSAADEAERREEMAELTERLRALPEPQRAAIVMRELEGLGHEEIAAALGVSGGAARQAIFRARRALRDGVGMLVPLPVLRLLIDYGAEAGVAAGAGGAAVAAGGAGTALKVGLVTAVLAGSVGTGLAIKDDSSPEQGPDPAAAAVPSGGGGNSSVGAGALTGDDGSSRSGRDGSGSGEGRGPGGSGDDRGGDGPVGASGGHGRSGPDGPDPDGGAIEGHGGPGPGSGPGIDGGGSGPGGGGGSGPGGGGSSGPGPGSDDGGGHSGPGDGGSSGSGSGGDGSSGPGGGDGSGSSGPGGGGGELSGPSGDGGSSGPGGGGDDLTSDDGAPFPETTVPLPADSSGSSRLSGSDNSGPGSLDGGGGHSGPG